jgi:hypothetical protein
MKVLIVLSVLTLYVVAADIAANILRGIPGDQAFCAISDGTYIYQGSNTDPGKIVKVKLSDLSRVGEAIISSNAASYLCPATFDVDYQNMYFVSRKGDNTASGNVLIKVDASLQNPTVTDFSAPAGSAGYFSSMFSDATYLYLVYYLQSGTEILRFKISDLSDGGRASVSSTSAVSLSLSFFS